MKAMPTVFSVFVLLFIAVSCATGPIGLPEKYNLDTDLETVNEISSFRVSSWETVDNQSIILRSNRTDYYLLVLHRPVTSVISSEKIGISSTVKTIKAGYDKIFVKDSIGIQYYVIDKIYKLDGNEMARDIKKRLRQN